MFSNKECSRDPLEKRRRSRCLYLSIWYTNIWAFFNFINCCFSLVIFGLCWCAKACAKMQKEYQVLQVLVKMATHRYGGIRPYHAPVPLPQPEDGNKQNFVESHYEHSDHRYGGIHPYRLPVPTSSKSCIFQNWYRDNSDRPYGGLRLYRAPIPSAPTQIVPGPVAAIPSMGGIYQYRPPIPSVGPQYMPREEVNLNQNYSYSLSSSSKLKTNSIGSSNLFVFYSITSTPSNHGMFLLRSPTYFQQIHALALAIINLDLGLIINFIILMSMLDFEIWGDSFIICVEDHHMLISIESKFYLVKVFNFCLKVLN